MNNTPGSSIHNPLHLFEWSIVDNYGTFVAPTGEVRLRGTCYNHPYVRSGHIMTSRVIYAHARTALTKSGRWYVLVGAHPAYKKWVHEQHPRVDLRRPFNTGDVKLLEK